MNIVELQRLYRSVWLVDFEFHQPDGCRPTPLCFVAKELFTGDTIRRWEPFDCRPNYGVGEDDLFVSYYSTAELGCHLALRWPMPDNILDLYAEFRRHVCGLTVLSGHGLLGALAYFGLNGLEGAVKDEMRTLVMRGGPYTDEEKGRVLDYCESDVSALARLLPKLLDDLDLPRALIRGKYMAALAHVEWRGVPVNVLQYRMLRDNWDQVQLSLIESIDADYRVYAGRTFKRDRFLEWCGARGISWPMLASGLPALDGDTFKDLARIHPELTPLKELRVSLGQMRLNELKIGADGRNRCLLSPFSSRTGRNQPSSSSYIFGPAVWLRNLIKAEPGKAIAYLDFEQQEFAIAAYLSKDEPMMAAYQSGDPYLAFAIQAGAAPADATKESHQQVRDRFKACALAVQYGMEAVGLGQRLGLSPAHGRELIGRHKQSYARYWQWSQAVQDRAMLHGFLTTTYGWRVSVGPDPNPRSLRNFPIQGNGAEMLRLSIILAHEAGVRICAPVHDALLIEAPRDEIEQAVEKCGRAMTRASELVLPGFPVRVEAKVFTCDTHYSDKRGQEFWKKLWELPYWSNVSPSASATDSMGALLR